MDQISLPVAVCASTWTRPSEALAPMFQKQRGLPWRFDGTVEHSRMAGIPLRVLLSTRVGSMGIVVFPESHEGDFASDRGRRPEHGYPSLYIPCQGLDGMKSYKMYEVCGSFPVLIDELETVASNIPAWRFLRMSSLSD